MQNPTATTNAAGRRNFHFVRVAGWLTACVLLASAMQAADLRPALQPGDVFAYPPKLSSNLQRVAVLPLTSESEGMDLPAGCEALQPILLDELVRTKKFEVVSVGAETLRVGSGRPAWTGEETLPVDFFDSLKREYGCDAVMFCQLTVYRAYAPLVIGWRLKLVDVHTREIIWAADQVFDMNQASVAKNAWEFLLKRDKAVAADESRWIALNSPRQFGHYTAAAILATLPQR